MDNKDETIVENVEIRFDNFDPKDMGILEPIFYHEGFFSFFSFHI